MCVCTGIREVVWHGLMGMVRTVLLRVAICIFNSVWLNQLTRRSAKWICTFVQHSRFREIIILRERKRKKEWLKKRKQRWNRGGCESGSSRWPLTSAPAVLNFNSPHTGHHTIASTHIPLAALSHNSIQPDVLRVDVKRRACRSGDGWEAVIWGFINSEGQYVNININNKCAACQCTTWFVAGDEFQQLPPLLQ